MPTITVTETASELLTLTVLNEGPLKSSTQSDPGNQTAAPPAKIKTMRLENPQKPLKTPRLPDLDPYLRLQRPVCYPSGSVEGGNALPVSGLLSVF
ncbi:unnamed protein product [Tetraodon nigroviridis]|uniref:Chromosome 12 SCAF14999, whole genome shotgun sequence n=1 Tax=Tetraodon nigroviridis TaxID=99883 RepID=Q4RSN8_TETNG|nr:unnamed protein product [Tetraodon nigroviridis]